MVARLDLIINMIELVVKRILRSLQQQSRLAPFVNEDAPTPMCLRIGDGDGLHQ